MLKAQITNITGLHSEEESTKCSLYSSCIYGCNGIWEWCENVNSVKNEVRRLIWESGGVIRNRYI